MLTPSWLSDKPEIASTDLRNLLLVGNRQWNVTITRTYLNHGRQVTKGTCSFVEQNAGGDVIQTINEIEETENTLNPYLVPPTTRTNKIHLQEDKKLALSVHGNVAYRTWTSSCVSDGRTRTCGGCRLLV